MSRAASIKLQNVATAAEHFRLVEIGCVLKIIEQYPQDERGDLVKQLPFIAKLVDKAQRLAHATAIPGAGAWLTAVEEAARGSIHARTQLPLLRLHTCGFVPPAASLLCTLALVDLDSSLAYLIEPEGGFPTLGRMVDLWHSDANGARPAQVRETLLDLIAAGLIDITNPDAPRDVWRLRLPEPLLDMLAGGRIRMDGVQTWTHDVLPQSESWRAPHAKATLPENLAQLLIAQPARLIIVRGPSHNGRRLFLEATAQAAGHSVMYFPSELFADRKRWLLAGAIAQLNQMMVITELTPSPGETFALPDHPHFSGPIGVIMPQSGSVKAAGNAAVVNVDLGLPDGAARAGQWRAYGLGRLAEDLSPIMITMGHIARAAAGAKATAMLRGAKNIAAKDVHCAVRALRDARLDALATPIDLSIPPQPIQLETEERAEFESLLLRMHDRENSEAGRGVRALFSGASGTGKTLAARHVAKSLGKDLFRIDLAATVSKYIGETEKSLDAALSAAEELDIILLLDEGDALMARRTDIGNANDRYANMETNFLLQRLENFAGVILITTNDAERIDQAFARRMDAVLSFRPPNEVRRLAILTQLLGANTVPKAMLNDIACRCELNGGNLRNVALHAKLLARQAGHVPDAEILRAAIEREYRKTGDYTPFRPNLIVA